MMFDPENESPCPLSLLATPKSGYASFAGRPEELFPDLHFSPPPIKTKTKERHITGILSHCLTLEFVKLMGWAKLSYGNESVFLVNSLRMNTLTTNKLCMY